MLKFWKREKQKKKLRNSKNEETRHQVCIGTQLRLLAFPSLVQGKMSLAPLPVHQGQGQLPVGPVTHL